MVPREKRVLDVRDAARLIYRVREPSPEQLDKIRYRLARGVLKSSAQGRWTTTPEFVAEFLAQASVNKETAPKSAIRLPVGRVYRELLLDYCLAVLMRQKAARRSRAFARAVVVGQVLCLVFLLTVAALGWSGVQRSPPEQAIIERWIAENEGRHTILHWHAIEESGDATSRRCRVEYRYSPSKYKAIHTERVFLVRDGRVVQVVQPGSED